MSKGKGNLDDLDAYHSDFDEDDEEREEQKRRRHDLAGTGASQPGTSHPQTSSTSNHRHSAALPPKEQFEDERRRADSFKNSYGSLNAFERHRKLVNDYFAFHSKPLSYKRDSSRDKTDSDIVKENHRFIWKDEDEADTWEKQMAKRYYDKLFKEYCICDLSRYKEKKIGFRWRTENEVILGKGQFKCGAKGCDTGDGLRSWEVNFAYMEEFVKKNALVKLRLCEPCSAKLNAHERRTEVKRKAKRKRRREGSNSKESGSSQSQGDGTAVDDKEVARKETEQGLEGIWKAPVEVPDVKSRDEEFEDYFGDLFQ